ncbi:MAG: dynamin family protein [Polyangiaceae bacterium]|nr:dynamin family protein [Polyangiaceae bacterium]
MLDHFQERKQTVVEVLGSVATLAEGIGATSLARRVRREIVDKLAEGRFHLVVVGEFNHGKTTFVNALLGSSVLPVGVTPTTAVIHNIVWGQEPRARLVFEDGTSEVLPFDDVGAVAAGRERDTEGVRHLEIEYPAPLLAEEVVLVDTPGVNDLSLTRAEITYGYIPRSDAVLFVLDAGQPVKESERQFLQHQIIGKNREKIFFVVGKSDIWSVPEREQGLAYIKKRLAELVSEPAVFPVSAQAALGGRREESGLDELLLRLTEFLAEERGTVMLSNALSEGLGALGVLSRGVAARKRALALTEEQLARRIELLDRDLAGHAETLSERRLAIREEVGSIKAWARRDLDRFCDDVLAQLPSVLERSSADDLKQHLGPFLSHAFREWAELETQEIARALEALAERMVALTKEDAHDAGRRLSETVGGEISTPAIEVDRFAYDVGIFAVLSVGMGVVFANAMLGGLLLAAAPALALWNRGRTEAEIKKRALELAPVVLRETAAKVAPQIDQLVDETAERLDQWVVTAGEELHREVLEVLTSAQQARRTVAQDGGVERALAESAEKRLEELEASLKAETLALTGASLEEAS